MKKYIYIIMITGLVFLQGCNPKEDDLGTSDIDISTPELTELDVWIRENYTYPFNIEVLYEWNESVVDFNRFLFPPTVSSVQPALEAVKTIWLDSYTEVGGENFIKNIAPREIVLIGGINLNESGTITLGLAEAGTRITFFNTDLLDNTDRDNIIRFISTIQHEYAHILNQTHPFDEEAYEAVNAGDYGAQWFNVSDDEAYDLGFITPYASSDPNEDFAEMVSIMLSNDNEAYNAIIDAIPNTEAQDKIRAKEIMVVNYFKEEFNLDFYELQTVVANNINKVIN